MADSFLRQILVSEAGYVHTGSRHVNIAAEQVNLILALPLV
jgi:hypothetical protein